MIGLGKDSLYTCLASADRTQEKPEFRAVHFQ